MSIRGLRVRHVAVEIFVRVAVDAPVRRLARLEVPGGEVNVRERVALRERQVALRVHAVLVRVLDSGEAFGHERLHERDGRARGPRRRAQVGMFVHDLADLAVKLAVARREERRRRPPRQIVTEVVLAVVRIVALPEAPARVFADVVAAHALEVRAVDLAVLLRDARHRALAAVEDLGGAERRRRRRLVDRARAASKHDLAHARTAPRPHLGAVRVEADVVGRRALHLAHDLAFHEVVAQDHVDVKHADPEDALGAQRGAKGREVVLPALAEHVRDVLGLDVAFARRDVDLVYMRVEVVVLDRDVRVRWVERCVVGRRLDEAERVLGQARESHRARLGRVDVLPVARPDVVLVDLGLELLDFAFVLLDLLFVLGLLRLGQLAFRRRELCLEHLLLLGLVLVDIVEYALHLFVIKRLARVAELVQ
mmetsp:Transcript_2901/g.8614  ORF Transcript_2901/g.8614 Transcript_2901/m.8614 type:complete len:424 (-) Transcript_2901:172-1443(-)